MTWSYYFVQPKPKDVYAEQFSGLQSRSHLTGCE